MPSGKLRYITQEEAQKIDEELMSPEGAFALEQLMELAGLACAQTLAECYPLEEGGNKKVLVVCGPGNQGGDGLVAARHLALWGYDVQVYVPKPGKKDLYQALTRQCENMRIDFLDSVEAFEGAVSGAGVILDAVFGFSFKPPLRAPFDRILSLMGNTATPIVSVDIPSGWDVMAGPPEALTASGDEGKEAIQPLWPAVVVSLTAPKEGMRAYARACKEGGGGNGSKRHFLGGRFVPPGVAEKYKLDIPQYPGYQQIVEITGME